MGCGRFGGKDKELDFGHVMCEEVSSRQWDAATQGRVLGYRGKITVFGII